MSQDNFATVTLSDYQARELGLTFVYRGNCLPVQAPQPYVAAGTRLSKLSCSVHLPFPVEHVPHRTIEMHSGTANYTTRILSYVLHVKSVKKWRIGPGTSFDLDHWRIG